MANVNVCIQAIWAGFTIEMAVGLVLPLFPQTLQKELMRSKSIEAAPLTLTSTI